MSCKIINGDCIEVMRGLDPESVHCCVTSPPYYGLRDYGVDGQIGLEETPDAYVARMVDVFREVLRVLRDDGTVWLNLGDSYFSTTKGSGGPSDKQESNAGSYFNAGSRFNAGSFSLKPKDLIGIPWRVAFALQTDGWYLRQDIIWHKPNPMPESVRDRPTRAHEYVFLLARSKRYFYDADAVSEPMKASSMTRVQTGWNGDSQRGYKGGEPQNHLGKYMGGEYARTQTRRNRRSVWTVTTKPYSGAHFATFPPDLIEPCILAGCPVGGVVLDPFGGSGTTGAVAIKHRRNAVLIELNPEYIPLINERIRQAEADAPLLLDDMEARD